MAMNWQSEEDSSEVISTINTTPLVDVMLVLLIIFLITIPVVTHTVPVALPKESSVPTQTKPENVSLSVDHDGQVFWNQDKVDARQLEERLQKAALIEPQPEIHIRGDEGVRYEFVGRVIAACQKARIAKVGFITEPAPHS